MKMRVWFGALALSVVCGSVMATASRFAGLDTDFNGYISKKEAQALPALVQLFDSADTDRDGHLNPNEFAEIALRNPELKQTSSGH